MAVSLPQELLLLIASHITGKEVKLTPYTLVSKSWQAAFERGIYSSLVVLSPSDREYVTVSPTKRLKKHGLSLSRLDDITSEPQDWRRARRTYVRRIIYRCAVPYWFDEDRVKNDDYTYDNAWRRKNNFVFSEGVQALFDYLSQWTNQAISLEIALQAESAYIDEDHYEPGTLPISDGFDEELAPYCATFLSDRHLATSKCVKSLEFPQIELPDDNSDKYRGYSEDRISPSAVLKIASACVTLQKIKIEGECGIPCADSVLWWDVRNVTAVGLSELPPSIQDVEWIGDAPLEYDNPDVRLADVNYRNQDPLCTALHKISRRLKSLRIEAEAVFSELFCLDEPRGLTNVHWPHLETLHLERIDEMSPASAITRYADGSTDDQELLQRYMDDLYASFGHAAQKMPHLKDAVLQFGDGQGLEFYFGDGQWILFFVIRQCDTYEPSSRVLQAWKVPQESLKPCTGAPYYREARYSAWPPL